MATKKLSLYKQAQVELKRRQLKIGKAGEFNPKKKYTEQMRALLPNINWKPKQADFINAKQFMKWYLGGYKSGKTFTGVSTDIWLSYINRPYPGILVHPTMDGNEITIIPLIEEICEMNNIEFEIKKLRTKFKAIFKFGMKPSEWGALYLASGDTPKSLKGPKLAFGHIDEPLVMKEEITEVIMSRLAEGRSTLRMLLNTGTPEPEHMQWGFDIVDKEFEDSETRFITTVSTREVLEYLADGYIQELEKNLTAAQIETFVDGKYRNLSQGKVYSSFDKKKNVRDLSEWNVFKKMDLSEAEYALGYDFNVNQMSATFFMLCGRYKIKLEEFRIRARSDTKELTGLAIRKLTDKGYIVDGRTRNGRSLIVTGDASGKATSSKSRKSDYDIIMKEFENEGIEIMIYVPDANPAIRDRVNYINLQFDNETFIISEECTVEIRDRELCSYKLGAEGFAIDKSKKELTHMSDASDYVIFNTQIITETDPDNLSSIFTKPRLRRI